MDARLYVSHRHELVHATSGILEFIDFFQTCPQIVGVEDRSFGHATQALGSSILCRYSANQDAEIAIESLDSPYAVFGHEKRVLAALLVAIGPGR